ncbi:putative reverse transcriptase domain-containing protein [Tanacetum coccineum]|uniref:Reverse transcriptase domain-containing protein n=1 Tax=Tanacetum coccineum TaxID=301880 RepID=A0ABQ5BL52_9ASTR
MEQEEAFQTLKDNLCNAPIWSLPDGSEDFVVYCDVKSKIWMCIDAKRQGKANVVADTLSRKERVKPRRVREMSMTIQSSVKDKILAAQGEASKVENAPAEMLRGLDQQMEKKEDRGMYFMDRIWVPLVGDVRKIIMDEAHASSTSVHLAANKTCYDLRGMYWWPCTRKDIATYVSDCLTCSKVKAEISKTFGFVATARDT